MFKYQDASATPGGEFTDGDPLNDIPRTLLRSSWTNMVQRELLALVVEAGIEPDPEDFQQVAEAVSRISTGLKSHNEPDLNALTEPGKHYICGWSNGPVIPGIFALPAYGTGECALVEVFATDLFILQRFTIMRGFFYGVQYSRRWQFSGGSWTAWASPAATEQKANQSAVESGYVTLPGGILMQWVKVPEGSPSGLRTINWPKPFSAAVFSVQTTNFSNSPNNSNVYAYDLSSVTVRRYTAGSADGSTASAMVFAVGK